MVSKSFFLYSPAFPKAVYTDLSTFFAVIQAHARDNRYIFRVRNSKLYCVLYNCDCTNNYDSKSKKAIVHFSKQRNSKFKKCSCKIRVVVSKDIISESWTI